MARPLKIFLWIVGIFFGLIAVAAIALPLIVNPNNYKGQITTAAKDKTGRDLSINDIKLRVLPWLGVKVTGVTVGNAAGFGAEPFAQVGEADVGVKLMPLLFHQQVVIGTVTLDGLVLNAAKHKDGTTNWDDFTKEQPGQKKEVEIQTKPEQPGGKQVPIALTVGGLKITNSHVTFVDEQAGATYKIEEFDLKTGSVKPNEPVDVELAMKASSTKPQVAADLKVALTVLPKLEEKIYEVQKLKVDLGTTGSGIPGGKQDVTITGKALYDGGKGTMTLSDAALEAAGLVLKIALQAEGLNGDAAALSGNISTNTFNPREVTKKIGVTLPPTADPAALTAVSFSAKLAGTSKNAELNDIALKLDQTNVTGHAAIVDTATSALRFAFKVDSIDADRYMAPAPKAGGEKKEEGKKSDINAVELPVDALDQLNAQGTLDIGSLKASGAKLSDVAMKVNFPKGQVKTEELTAKLYGGTVNNTTRITPGAKPRYDVQLALKQINAGPLLQDVAGKNYLSGTGDFTLNGNAAGKTVGEARKALNGNVALSLVKGAIEGFNLQKTVKQARAALNGQAAADDNSPSRTEFSDLKGSGKITNGVLRTDALTAKGSSLSFNGAGAIDIGNEQIDYTLTTNVTGDNPDLAQLKGTPIPVKVTGPWSAPKVRVDLESIARQRGREEIKKQGGKLLENFLKKH
jgi:AsmA protein